MAESNFPDWTKTQTTITEPLLLPEGSTGTTDGVSDGLTNVNPTTLGGNSFVAECNECGLRGHSNRFCPKMGRPRWIQCRTCSEWGHIAKDCPDNVKVVDEEEGGNEDKE